MKQCFTLRGHDNRGLLTKGLLIASVALLLLIHMECLPQESSAAKVITGPYWKDQAIAQIIHWWTEYAQDTSFGGFITNLDENWHSSADTRKYPSMIGRHIFSYSAAYLLTGDEKYLEIAEKTKDYLIDKAWDKEYGGWYSALNRDGSPCETTKSIFIQTYAVTGLAMYYFVTHDPEALNYIKKTNNLIESFVWDHENGGYFNLMSRNWKVTDNGKSFASQAAPVSGYLVYLYLATREKKYLLQAQRLMDMVVDHTRDRETGWVLEHFDKGWSYLPGNPDQINVGHNLEVVWMLVRLSMLELHKGYLNVARVLDSTINTRGFDRGTGMWQTILQRTNPWESRGFTYWWVQAYGNMVKLVAYQQNKQKHYVSDFIKGAVFWDSYFIDKKNGDTFFSVDTSGKPMETKKGDAYKTSYHSMEHCLLNYIYVSSWINKAPVELFFRIKSPSQSEVLFPIPVEDKHIVITNAWYSDRERLVQIEYQPYSVLLPAKKDLILKVQFTFCPDPE